jgi:hypothetical protein
VTAPVTPQSAVCALYEAVKADFAARAIGAQVFFGLKYRDLWDTSRVVLIDGDFNGSNVPSTLDAGTFGAPWQASSTNPRELIGWERPLTLSIRGVDPSNPDSIVTQTQATEALIEATVQSMHNAFYTYTDPNLGVVTYPLGQNQLRWGKAKWVNPGSSTQQTWGMEFLVSLIYRCVLYALPVPIQTVTQAIAKQVVPNRRSGTAATLESMAGTTVIVGGLAFVGYDWAGTHLTLSGAANSANDGTFPIAAVVSPTEVAITNAAGVVPDANSGSLSWSVGP